MPVTVTPHADFESLVEGLGGFGPPGEPVLRPVIVPSLAFADHLQRRVADRQGVFMGMEILMTQDFIHRAVGPGRGSPWTKRQLAWGILPHAGSFAEQLGVGNPSPRDRLALAELVADRIDQYGHFRPEMIRRWAREGDAVVGANEAWQRDLWRTLQAEIAPRHPSLEMADRQRDAAFWRGLAARFPRLLVLGATTLDPLLVEVLEPLARAGSEVDVHVVLPSLGYLGDLRRRGALPGDALEDWESHAGHPLLESLGRQAVGAFLLLGKLDENYTHWPEPERDGNGGSSVLARLQADVRALRAPEPGSVHGPDASLSVHSCFGPRREMEALRDEILRAFDELDGLQPDEVHIVTPDLEAYAPLVSAVLRRGATPLPVRLSELPPAEQEPLAEALLALLEIAHSGRFDAADVLDLVRKPAVQALLGDGESAEVCERWIRESGLTHGLGASPGEAAFARHRLAAGRFFNPASAARYPDGTYVLPVADPLSGGLDRRTQFLEWLAALEATVAEWKGAAAASVWAGRLRRACAELFAGSDEAADVVEAISFLESQTCEVALDAGAVLDVMRAELSATTRRAGVAGHIAFGRFKQLQNLPCRVLAMVGMQDAAFPTRNRLPAWDLLHEAPRAWDRNPRLDDRQLFLDALLTPTDRLLITASTRNVRTRESEPFSSCVDELLRVVETMGGGRPVVEHRLQPFAADYFRSGTGLPRSYDVFHADVAGTVAAAESAGEGVFWNPAGEHAATVAEVTVGQLAAFWRSPALGFLKACGLPRAEEDVPDEELNRAPLALDRLQTWSLKDRIVRSVLRPDGDLDLEAARAGAERRLPPRELGELAWAQNLSVAKPLGRAVAARQGETVALQWGDGPRVTGTLLRAGDGTAWISYRTGKMEKTKYFLEPWIAALLASASGHALPTLVLTEEQPDSPREHAAPDPDEARRLLGVLVRGWLDGQSRPLRFAPATSEALVKKLEGTGGDEEAALAAACAEWAKPDSQHDSGGEGLQPDAQLAWRDRDPFEDGAEWVDLAREISGPLRTWKGTK